MKAFQNRLFKVRNGWAMEAARSAETIYFEDVEDLRRKFASNAPSNIVLMISHDVTDQIPMIDSGTGTIPSPA